MMKHVNWTPARPATEGRTTLQQTRKMMIDTVNNLKYIQGWTSRFIEVDILGFYLFRKLDRDGPLFSVIFFITNSEDHSG